MAVYQAAHRGLKNFSMLISHVLVPPAIEALMSSPNCRVQGFLAAGHVCAVMGYEEYPPIAAKYHVPIVVTGFEPLDIFQGVLMVVQQLESGRPRLKINTPAPCAAKATSRRRSLSARFSRSCRASGAASAKFRRAASA